MLSRKWTRNINIESTQGHYHQTNKATNAPKKFNTLVVCVCGEHSVTVLAGDDIERVRQ